MTVPLHSHYVRILSSSEASSMGKVGQFPQMIPVLYIIYTGLPALEMRMYGKFCMDLVNPTYVLCKYGFIYQCLFTALI